MKHLLGTGKPELLMSDSGGGCLSGEAHLVRQEGQRYVVRRCDTLSRAKRYEEFSRCFGKYGFLPEFLGRSGKDVFYEYIEGRDLRKNEPLKVFEQIGKIAAHINEINAEGSVSTRFYRQVRELVTGNFAMNPKVLVKRIRVKGWRKPKPLLTEQYARRVRACFKHLERETNPTLALDANDINPTNFRLRKGKVYFVDVEAIKPRIKGFGIGKCYLTWAKSPKKRRAFEKGYSSVSSIDFLTEEYLDFIFLNFVLQKINYAVNIFQDRGHQNPLNILEGLLEKYSL